jgi:hypothetical protein
MTNVNQGGNNFGFGYGDNGLLALRSNPWRTLTVNQRDGQGRLLQETATVGVSNVLVETLTWRTNFEISSYAATRIGAGAWNDSRVYQYNSRNQLIKEPLGITNNILATNSYAFDANKLGVLTGAQWSGGLSNGWQATVMNSLAQIMAETWNESSLTLRANGSAVNASSVSAKLDGSSVGSTLADGRWYSDLTLAPGSHTLAATASYSVEMTPTNGMTKRHPLENQYRISFLEFTAWQRGRCVLTYIHPNVSTQGPPTSRAIQVSPAKILYGSFT